MVDTNSTAYKTGYDLGVKDAGITNTADRYATVKDSADFTSGYNDGFNSAAPPPPPPASTGVDAFGTKMIYPTKQGGRVWNSPFNTGNDRTLGSGQRDGTNDLCPLGSASYHIVPSAGELRVKGDVPRVYVYDAARTKMFENIEVTAYYNMVASNGTPSYAGMEIGVRGQHELQKGSDVVKTYYVRHGVGGQWFRMKEMRHPTSSDKVVVSNIPYKLNTWYGMKHIVRTNGNGNVRLESYRDAGDGNWTKMSDFIDTPRDPWGGNHDTGTDGVNGEVYTSKAANCGCHSVFFRSDNVTDWRLKKCSIREIDTLP